MPLNISGNTLSYSGITSTGVFKRRINNDGLVLYLDAADKFSYNGGTTWYDLSGKGYTGTLSGNTYWDNTNGGRFVFDGTGDYIETNSSTILPNGTMEFTIETFYSLTANATGAIFTNYGTSYTANTVWVAGAYGVWLNAQVYATSTPLSNAIHHMAATRNTDGMVRLYVDGVLNNRGILSSTISTNQNYRIGADVNGAGEALNGAIYIIRVYTRSLQPSEIAENFRSNRERFGL